MDQVVKMGEVMDEKAQQLLEETDADARMRDYKGTWEKIIVALLVAWAGFQLYFSTIGIISAMNLRAFHCMFLLIFTFLLFLHILNISLYLEFNIISIISFSFNIYKSSFVIIFS